jgi:hypothetical protein
MSGIDEREAFGWDAFAAAGAVHVIDLLYGLLLIKDVLESKRRSYC